MKNDFYAGYYEDHYLTHSGVLGQRWGHRNGPPYPLKPEDHSASEKKAGWAKSLKEHHVAKKRKKQQKAALEKARQARTEKAKQAKLAKEFEEKRQEVLRSGKASEILKYKGQMTNQEMKDAIDRLDNESRLKERASAESKSTWDKIDNVISKASQVGDWAEKAVNGYNKINKFIGVINGEEDPETAKKEALKKIEDVKKSGNLKYIEANKKQLSSADLQEAMSKVKQEKILDRLLSGDEEAWEEVGGGKKKK